MSLRPDPQVRLAIVDGDLVILDLAGDSYLCLARSDAGPALDALADTAFDAGDPALAELIETGLLVEAPGQGAYIPPVRPRAHAALPELPLSRTTELPAVLPDFLCTLWRSVRLMRRRGARPWSSLAVRARCAPVTGEDDVLVMVDRFRRLRCLVPRTGRCLVQSLMLIQFLRRRGVAAEWVFGVRTHPFEAHCWVEWNGIVLNDGIDHVGWYTPIAAF